MVFLHLQLLVIASSVSLSDRGLCVSHHERVLANAGLGSVELDLETREFLGVGG